MSVSGQTRSTTEVSASSKFDLTRRCLLCSGPDGKSVADSLGSFRTCSEEVSQEPEHEETNRDIVSLPADSTLWRGFILKHVLNFPEEECQDIIDIYGAEAAEGTKICIYCVRFVQKFRSRHERIKKLQETLDCMRRQAEVELLQSVEEEGGYDRSGPSGGRKDRKEASVSGWVHDYFENLAYAAQKWQLESWEWKDSKGDEDWHRSSSIGLGSRAGQAPSEVSEFPESTVVESQNQEHDVWSRSSNMELRDSTLSISSEIVVSKESLFHESPEDSLVQEDGGDFETQQNENGKSCHVNCPHCRPPGSAECVFCERTFVNQLSLDKHILLRHTGETQQNPDNRDQDQSTTKHVAPVLTRRRCGLAKNKKPRDTGELPEKRNQIPQKGVIPAVARRRGTPAKNKKARHTGEKPTLTRGRKQSSGPVNKQTTRNYSCTICNKIFTKKGTLVQHTRLHTGERPFECQLCRRRFSRKGTLTRHVRTTHTKEKPYKCSKCGSSFRYKNSLTSHNVRFHTTGQPPYSCLICRKNFANSYNLKNHNKFFHS